MKISEIADLSLLLHSHVALSFKTLSEILKKIPRKEGFYSFIKALRPSLKIIFGCEFDFSSSIVIVEES